MARSIIFTSDGSSTVVNKSLEEIEREMSNALIHKGHRLLRLDEAWVQPNAIVKIAPVKAKTDKAVDQTLKAVADKVAGQLGPNDPRSPKYWERDYSLVGTLTETHFDGPTRAKITLTFKPGDSAGGLPKAGDKVVLSKKW